MKARLEGDFFDVDKLGKGEYRHQYCPFDTGEYQLCGTHCPHFRIHREQITFDFKGAASKADYVVLSCGGQGVTYELEVTP